MCKIIDKAFIKGKITILTGMHIGSSNEFAPIGAVGSIVVRNPLCDTPIIPGSSLKGKLRSLLEKTSSCISGCVEKKEPTSIKRLFGFSGDKNDETILARLQFFDLFMSNKEKIENIDTDLYLTEIKFENTICITTAKATPRQLERVIAGSEFDLKLIYNIESLEDIKKDIEVISKGFKLIQLDYLGGSGTRGYGKINISNLSFCPKNIIESNKDISEHIKQANKKLKEADDYAKQNLCI